MYLHLKQHQRSELTVGDVGFLTASMKNVGDSSVGDTITLADNPATEAFTWISKDESNGILWLVSN